MYGTNVSESTRVRRIEGIGDMNEEMADVIIIGGGPAGLLASIAAREESPQRSVIVLEAGPQAGRKLALTGGGRGNVTQAASVNELVRAFDPNGRFLYPALQAFGPADIRALFFRAGVPTHEEEDGRIFPDSQSARDLVQALLEMAEAVGVSVVYDISVNSIARSEASSEWIVSGGSRNYRSRTVILAGGGASYPAAGSNGSCLRLARDLSLPIRPFSPALAGVRLTNGSSVTGLAGISVDGAVSYRYGGRTVKKDRGGILITKTGFSGPLVLKHSVYWGRFERDDDIGKSPSAIIQEGRPEVDLRLHFLPDMQPEELIAKLEKMRAAHPARFIENLTDEPLPLALRRAAAFQAGAKDIPAASLTKRQLRAYSMFLCDWNVSVQVQAIGGAMVSRGGIELSAIDPRTMMAKALPGLFAAGEILDLTGPSGGYNLTAAFATGFLAGRSAVRY